jgi:hypothetical protein
MTTRKLSKSEPRPHNKTDLRGDSESLLDVDSALSSSAPAIHCATSSMPGNPCTAIDWMCLVRTLLVLLAQHSLALINSAK